ncbi:MAG: DUF2637 domain-containing protein [Actinomycetota bacterium]|nr:DUF2637 domain-containing protein [Actinomycetota bacterium]
MTGVFRWVSDLAERHGRRAAIAALLAVVVAAPIVISFASLTAYAVDDLGLGPRTAWALPVALDAAAMVMVALRWDATARGDSAAGPTALFWALVAGSAAANARHGAAVSDDAVVVLAAMPLVAALVLDVVLRHVRRDVLRSMGAVEDPIARFRLARWLVDRRGTWAAWRTSVLEGETSARRAIDLSRDGERTVPVPGGVVTVPDTAPDSLDDEIRTRFNGLHWDTNLAAAPSVSTSNGQRTPGPDTDTRTRPAPPARPDTGQWDTLSAAVDAAIAAGHDTPDTAVAWLADNGMPDAKRDSVRRTLRRKTGTST